MPRYAPRPEIMTARLDETRLRRLIEIGPWLISELELETVFDRLLEVALEVMSARYAALGVLDADRRLERFVTRGLSDAEERAIGPRPRGVGILGLLVDDPRPLRLDDLSAHPSSYGFPAGHPPMRTFLGVAARRPARPPAWRRAGGSDSAYRPRRTSQPGRARCPRRP